jgi:hypothetical protein
MSEGLLAASLATAVFVEIVTLQCMDDETRQAHAGSLRRALAGAGGDLLAAATADLLATARGIAALSFQPGGVGFAGRRWCAAHRGAPWTGADGQVCPCCPATP